MARKSNSNHKKKVSESGCEVTDARGQGKASEVKPFPREESQNDCQTSNPTNSVRRAYHSGNDNKIKQSSGKFRRKEKQGLDEVHDQEQSASSVNNQRDCRSSFSDTVGAREGNQTSFGSETGPEHKSGMAFLLNGLFHMRSMVENVEFSGNMVVRNLRAFALSLLKAGGEWLEKQRPLFSSLTTSIYNARDYAKLKIERAYPVVMKWLVHFGNIILLLSMVWLDCTLRGIDSFLRMGTSSFFSVIWCSVLSVFAMAGILKFLIVLVITALVGVFIGFTLGLLVVAISGIVFLWLYGSFWTTLFVIIMGGLAFMLSHERLALLITTSYSVYCAWTYVGWLGLVLALNLSFISSDILIYFLKNNVSHQRRSDRHPEQSTGTESRPGFFDGESFHAATSEAEQGFSADRSPGVPSTSGDDAELTSEYEVIRLLNCTDHYSALGLARYENVDVSLLKKEYRKKAMLVHPDKNMGNEKAAEAFKKLQNAYEVLLDSLKRKAYDDELRREDLLNYFRRFQSIPQKNGGHGFFAPGAAHSEANVEELFGDSRRIACKKCGNLHVWVLTKKSKSHARWCQECKDFHQAKDGDGWVEQSAQPLLFGLLQKVDAPCAYVCADSKIYNATEWYICQEMRCPVNTHKPSFHVNTSLTSKHNNTSKGSGSGQRGSGRMPTSNMEETMTEEEFYEWLQNAVQSGMFDNFSGSTSAAESPSARAGTVPKSSASSSGKRKKKGKKQW